MKRIIYVKQTDLKDCGVSCLMSLVNYYGGYVTREYLRNLTKTSSDGVSVYSLAEAGEKLGFETKALRGGVLNLQNNLPVIAHIVINKQMGHFVVITKITEKEIKIMDPALGFKTYDLATWNKMTTNVYLLFKPKTEILKQMKEKSFFTLFIPIISPFKNILIFLFVFSGIYTICNILVSYQFQFFIDLVSANNKATLNYIFLFLLLVVLLKEVTNLFRSNLLNYLNHKLDETFLKEVYNHIIKLPYLYFLNRTKADIMLRIKDIYTIRDVISKVFVTVSIDLILLIGVFIILFKINTKLSFLLLGITLLYGLVILIYNNLLQENLKEMKDQELIVENHLLESLSSINTIKGMQLEEVLKTKLSSKYKDFQDLSFNLYHTFTSETFLKDLIYGVGLVLIIFLGIKEVMNQNFALARLLVFYSLLTYYFSAIGNICSLQILLKESYVSFIRIKELLNVKGEDFSLDEKIVGKHLKGNIKIQNLHYSYNLIDEVLTCPNLEIKEGERVLLYGISGGGKSTLMKLITRYIDNYEGDIYIDDRKIYNYNLKELRKRITYLSQDERLFTDTIYNNIVLDYQVSYDKYLKVIKVCGVDEIIERSLLKDEMLLDNDASNLSGGERQRIILARTILKDSDIYIFDESFNALDINNEREIIKNIFAYLQNKTIIVISHRFNNHDLYQKLISIKGGVVYEN